MKQILHIAMGLALSMLAGCTVAPSTLGVNIAGVSGPQSPKNLSPIANGAPSSTGSIVPLRDEGVVVDLPDSSHHMQASSAYQNNQAQEQAGMAEDEPLSAKERHRRELINRGDLQEGQALPVQ